MLKDLLRIQFLSRAEFTARLAGPRNAVGDANVEDVGVALVGRQRGELVERAGGGDVAVMVLSGETHDPEEEGDGDADERPEEGVGGEIAVLDAGWIGVNIEIRHLAGVCETIFLLFGLPDMGWRRRE